MRSQYLIKYLVLFVFLFFFFIFKWNLQAMDQIEKREATSFVPITDMIVLNKDDFSSEEKVIKITGYLPNRCYKLPVYKSVKEKPNSITVKLWSVIEQDHRCLQVVQPFSKYLIVKNNLDYKDIEITINPNSNEERIYYFSFDEEKFYEK